MERDIGKYNVMAKTVISTHTLTWSVTKLPSGKLGQPLISTHTLTWSVTRELGIKLLDQLISTHTLTWSVTAQALIDEGNFEDFNSHAHVERDIVFRQ